MTIFFRLSMNCFFYELLLKVFYKCLPMLSMLDHPEEVFDGIA